MTIQNQTPNEKQTAMIKVFYTPQMVAKVISSSPSPSKPVYVVDSWRSKLSGLQIEAPAPATVEMFYRAHSKEYVDGIMACRIPNGFRTKDMAVAMSLPYTTGAMLAAAREALVNGKVAVAPCSGFHHAAWDEAEGYCTFNGLLVTAMVLKNEGRVARVGILDFDQHYGNGTQHIIDHLGLDWITHYSAGAHYDNCTQAEEFLQSIPGHTNSMANCDLVLYQAGADPHVNDPLGGWLTTEQLRRRDQLVFEAFSRLDVPVAWNLAGGYQEPFSRVLEIHDNTMKACIDVYCSQDNSADND